MGSIPFFKPWVTEGDAISVADQVESGWIGPGKKTEFFARSIAAYASSEYCVLTTSGTIALSLAAVALPPGYEVLLPAYGVSATTNAMKQAGYTPRFVDIDRETGCMDVNQIHVSPMTAGICWVDFSGHVGLDTIGAEQMAKDNNIWFIEDACCALGNRYNGVPAGSFGDASAFSFGSMKIVSSGQGGAILTDNREVYERCLAVIDHGGGNWRHNNLHVNWGVNLRFNDVLASLGRSQMMDIDDRLQRRAKLFGILQDKLEDTLFDFKGDIIPYHHVVFTDNRDQLLLHLHEMGVDARWQYRTLTQHPVYEQHKTGEYPNADWWTEHAVYLPFGLGQSEEDMDEVARHVKSAGVRFLEP